MIGISHNILQNPLSLLSPCQDLTPRQLLHRPSTLRRRARYLYQTSRDACLLARRQHAKTVSGPKATRSASSEHRKKHRSKHPGKWQEHWRKRRRRAAGRRGRTAGQAAKYGRTVGGGGEEKRWERSEKGEEKAGNVIYFCCSGLSLSLLPLERPFLIWFRKDGPEFRHDENPRFHGYVLYRIFSSQALIASTASTFSFVVGDIGFGSHVFHALGILLRHNINVGSSRKKSTLRTCRYIQTNDLSPKQKSRSANNFFPP